MKLKTIWCKVWGHRLYSLTEPISDQMSLVHYFCTRCDYQDELLKKDVA